VDPHINKNKTIGPRDLTPEGVAMTAKRWAGDSSGFAPAARASFLAHVSCQMLRFVWSSKLLVASHYLVLVACIRLSHACMSNFMAPNMQTRSQKYLHCVARENIYEKFGLFARIRSSTGSSRLGDR
jgi:hypothetical protein